MTENLNREKKIFLKGLKNGYFRNDVFGWFTFVTLLKRGSLHTPWYKRMHHACCHLFTSRGKYKPAQFHKKNRDKFHIHTIAFKSSQYYLIIFCYFSPFNNVTIILFCLCLQHCCLLLFPGIFFFY